ncbi:HicA-like toxin [Arthrobacter phage Rizwana]|nr:HicA-like toxin [Arthrobacter phage Rizwana]
MSRHAGDFSRALRKRCNRRPELRELLMEAHRAGVGSKFTKSGIILYGENGQIASTHFTGSDHRGYKNLRRELQRKGIYPKGIN